MRLTLRTLLAWLDDTLPPEEVREIGKQVSETPFAQQLVERIRKVTRRRRLTVPPSTGTEAADPNVVAAYLDNELEAEKVAEYEKLCLASDVNLAEAASCHQILSLIRNKAKVPPEARYRMYRLIKGREAVRTSYVPTSGGSGTRAGAVSNAAIGNAPPPWSEAASPRTSMIGRIGPPLLAVALIVVLGLVGWMNIRSVDDPVRIIDDRIATAPDAVDRPRSAVGPPPIDGSPRPVDEGSPADEVVPPPDVDLDASDEVEPTDGPPAERPQAPPPPGDVAGVVEETDGILLRATRNGAAWAWEPLGPEDTLEAGDRLINLAPFRTTLALGSIRATMIAQSELVVGRPGDEHAAGFDLIEGSVVLDAEADRTIAVGFEGRTVAVEPPPGRPVGVSWYGLKAPGEEAGRPLLTIMTPDGTMAVSIDGDETPESFEGPILVSIDAEDGLLGGDPAVMPRWVVDPEPPPAEVRASEAFAELFEDSTGPMTFVLLEGTEVDDPDVRNLSVAALGAMGGVDPSSLELVMPMLNRPGDPATRSTAIGVLMRRMSRGPEAAEEIRGLLDRFVDPPEAADDLDRLLIGYGEGQLAEEGAVERLVDDLASPNPSVRQLALDTLRMLTGRDALGYDPDAPEGPGLKAWQDLLKAGRLEPGPGAPAGSNPGDRRR